MVERVHGFLNFGSFRVPQPLKSKEKPVERLNIRAGVRVEGLRLRVVSPIFNSPSWYDRHHRGGFAKVCGALSKPKTTPNYSRTPFPEPHKCPGLIELI